MNESRSTRDGRNPIDMINKFLQRTDTAITEEGKLKEAEIRQFNSIELIVDHVRGCHKPTWDAKTSGPHQQLWPLIRQTR